MLPSYNFDLNAADESDLRTVPGISAALAKSIVDGRERRGFFKSIEDLSTVPGVTGEILEEFRGMQALLRDKLSKQKIREDDTGSANWILLLFLSSYVLAALFQVLGLVLFAALIYVLLLRLLPRVKRSQQTDDGKRRRIRRAARFIRPGLGPAVLAFLLSLGFYFAGLSLTPWLMAATAPVFWFVFAFVRGLRRKAIPLTLKGSMYTLAGWVLVFAITGLAY
ncbi:MAG: helix-hairpin-helix domain-containing protein [Acidobacteria bacterium]|nr:MAG: helix-hairpin-helix domain-containing protein [Acidobacteriota bacterium]